MARIPSGEQFGNVVARPGPVVGASAEAYGAGVARAVQGVGETGMRIAGNEMAQAAAEAKQLEREQAAEAKQLQREQDAEAKAAAREAKRVQALTTTAKVRGGLLSLHDQLQADLEGGTIDKSQVAATWTERSGTLLQDSLAGVDPEHRDLVNATLLDDVGRYGQSVNKMVVARDKKDILTGGLSYIEEMQRYAARGPKEADEAIANVDTFWKATGPMAGEDPATAALRVQRFKEGVRSNQATALVNADPGAAVKALKNPNYLPELDPKERTNLLHTADAALLRNQQRAHNNAEAAARAQTKAWEGVQAVFQAGKMPTPAYAAQLTKTFKGTPYEDALASMMADGPANVAFTAQPVQAQAAALTELQLKMNRGGATPEDLKNYQRMETAHKATVADIKADPYQAAADRGMLTELAPLSLDIKQLPGQLVARAVQANTVSRWAGQEVSLFRPAEADKVAGVLQALPPKDRANALEGMAKAMTPGQMRAFSKQLGAKDDTLSAAALLSANSARTTSGRLVSELVLAGSDAIKDKRVKFDKPETEIRAEIDKATRGAFLSEDAQRAAGDAALSVYAGLLAEGKSPDAEQAVKLATGGIMDLNGAKFVKPWGWSDSQVSEGLRKFDAPKVQALTGDKPLMVGGAQVAPEQLAQHLPKAQLGPSPKPGHYTVTIGGRMVATADGKPFLLPLNGGQ